MIFGYALDSENESSTCSELPDLETMLKQEHRFVWVDVEDPPVEELEQVAKLFRFHHEAVEDCLEGEQRPRIDEFDEYALIMLYGALGPGKKQDYSPRKLAIFISPKFIVTVHQEALITINRLRSRASKKGFRAKSTRPDTLMYMVVDSIVDNYMLVVERLDKQLNELEENSLHDNPDPELLSSALSLRREMLSLRQLASSVRELLQPLVTGELDYVSDKISTDFVHVRDHLTTTIEMIDNLRELLNGVRDNYHAALAFHANKVMQTLTIFASLFLPLSLVAGIYGMNTPLWPSVEKISTFYIIIGIMGTTIIGMLAFFKRRGWF